MDNNKKIAIIGCGYWGKNIVKSLYRLGKLDTICDKNTNILNGLKNKFPQVNITSNTEGIFKNPGINAVIIATPTITHYRLAKQAILSGKDVFVEKPLATNIKNAKELVRLSEQKRKILMVGHILRYHPAIIKLKELLSAGKLGKVQYIYSNRLNLGRLRTEEDILWSFAPHDLSTILMLLGEEPLKVTAFGGDYISRGIYDITLTTMYFKSGIRAHVYVSWLHPYKEQKLVVVGSKAMAVFDDLCEEKLRIYPHTIEWKENRIPVAHKAEYYVVPVRNAEPLKEELKHFIECIVYRRRPRTDGREALKVLKILEVAEKYLKENSYGQNK